MMLSGKIETRPNRPRDGRHCDLCGCSQPAVRCDKCGCQIFCLSCDDMYHRHPKRRFHLRKAVDPTPPTPQARPVLPMKVSHITTSPGDPSKMPLPPPRKKKPTKSFFDNFRRRSPSSDNNSPPLPKKEYSWTDRLGNIKKFMSNRPLPPLPTNDDASDNDLIQSSQSAKNDLSFIHRRVDDKPPQLPQRSIKPNEFARPGQEKENLPGGMQMHTGGGVRNGTLDPSQITRTHEFNGNESTHWNNGGIDSHQINTLNRQFQPGMMNQGGPGFPPRNMHQSASATDLQNLPGMEGHPGMPPPHYPHYPMNPHLPPHYPYPMYPPQFSNYPQYFGNSFANLSSQPTTTDGDFSDHSEASSRHHSGKKYPFRKRAKRSQSVMVDRMQYPGQFYPFGPFPPGYGPGPWGAPFPMEAPPSPSSSVRSLTRVGRTRRRKKMASEDDDEEFSMSSSPMSRPKSSSSERPRPTSKSAPLATQTTSSEDEESDTRDRRGGKDMTLRRESDPRRLPSPVPKSPQIVHKNVSKQNKRGTLRHSDAEAMQISPTKMERRSSRESNISRYSDADEMHTSPVKMERRSSQESNADPNDPNEGASAWTPQSSWQCKHCTFINSAGNRICQVCCKTATAEGTTLVPSRPNSASASSRKQSVSSEKSCSSPEKRIEEEEDINARKANQDMAVLNSALDEAEKEISRGLEELMKLKEDFSPMKSEEKVSQPSTSKPPTVPDESSSKPVYKSTGKMRTSILDKIISTNKQVSTSTSTETQTGSNLNTDRILEARRPSTSSTTSDAYNSPIAQSPQFERVDRQGGATHKSDVRKDSSCQTQTDDLMDYLERKKAEEDAFYGRPNNGLGFRYGDRMDTVTSPTQFMYDRGYGMMQRSHSRASLFTGRLNDFGPMDYGFGPAPMYRSVSRSSLTGDYPEGRLSEFHNLRKPEYYLSMEELVEKRRQESIRAQGLELVRMIREAEQQGFTADDIQVALNNCGKQNPLEWLQENWKIMVENVINLSTSYANDKKENDVGTISENEARDALRLHKGHIWASVTECVETRQRKFLELKARGNFNSKDITDALTSSQGDVELAYAKLTKSRKPFLMRIWGAGEGAQNQDGAIPKPNESFISRPEPYYKDNIDMDDVQSDGLWDEEEEDVEWDEDYEEEDEEEHEELDLQTCRDDLGITSDITTPDSDRSDYCDAFGSNTLERNMSLPRDAFAASPDDKQTKKSNGILSKLVALKKEDKGSKQSQSKFYDKEAEALSDNQNHVDESSVLDGQQKSYNPLNVIKSTISAIRDSVSGSSKNEKKVSNPAVEGRTIIVRDQIPNESLSDAKNSSPNKQNSDKQIADIVSKGIENAAKQSGAIPKQSVVKDVWEKDDKSTTESVTAETGTKLVEKKNIIAKDTHTTQDKKHLKIDLIENLSSKAETTKPIVTNTDKDKKSIVRDDSLNIKNNSNQNEKLSIDSIVPQTESRTLEKEKSPSINKSTFDKMKNDPSSIKVNADNLPLNTKSSSGAKQNAATDIKNKVNTLSHIEDKMSSDVSEFPPVFSSVKRSESLSAKTPEPSEPSKKGVTQMENSSSTAAQSSIVSKIEKKENERKVPKSNVIETSNDKQKSQNDVSNNIESSLDKDIKTSNSNEIKKDLVKAEPSKASKVRFLENSESIVDEKTIELKNEKEIDKVKLIKKVDEIAQISSTSKLNQAASSSSRESPHQNQKTEDIQSSKILKADHIPTNSKQTENKVKADESSLNEIVQEDILQPNVSDALHSVAEHKKSIKTTEVKSLSIKAEVEQKTSGESPHHSFNHSPPVSDRKISLKIVEKLGEEKDRNLVNSIQSIEKVSEHSDNTSKSTNNVPVSKDDTNVTSTISTESETTKISESQVVVPSTSSKAGGIGILTLEYSRETTESNDSFKIDKVNEAGTVSENRDNKSFPGSLPNHNANVVDNKRISDTSDITKSQEASKQKQQSHKNSYSPKPSNAKELENSQLTTTEKQPPTVSKTSEELILPEETKEQLLNNSSETKISPLVNESSLQIKDQENLKSNNTEDITLIASPRDVTSHEVVEPLPSSSTSPVKIIKKEIEEASLSSAVIPSSPVLENTVSDVSTDEIIKPSSNENVSHAATDENSSLPVEINQIHSTNIATPSQSPKTISVETAEKIDVSIIDSAPIPQNNISKQVNTVETFNITEAGTDSESLVYPVEEKSTSSSTSQIKYIEQKLDSSSASLTKTVKEESTPSSSASVIESKSKASSEPIIPEKYPVSSTKLTKSTEQNSESSSEPSMKAVNQQSTSSSVPIFQQNSDSVPLIKSVEPKLGQSSPSSNQTLDSTTNSSSGATSQTNLILHLEDDSKATSNQHSNQATHESQETVNNLPNSNTFAVDDKSQPSDSKSPQISPSSSTAKTLPVSDNETSLNDDESEEDLESSDESASNFIPPSPVDALRHRFEGLMGGNTNSVIGPIRPQSPLRRMSFRSTKAVIALEKTRDTSNEKPWFTPKPTVDQKKPPPKRSIKQQLEIERRVRKLVADRKCRTYRKAEVVVQLMDMNFEEEEALLAANECATLEQAISFLQQECLLCTGHYPVSHIVSMIHCPHKACRDCIRAYFTVQIRDRNIMELLCPFCNEPDIFDEDIAQDYFNHLDIMLKKLVDPDIHELFQRKLRDRVLMRDPNFRWCSQCSSGFIAMENLRQLVCPDCNAVMCASCRRPWEREHQGMSCEAFAALKDSTDPEAQAAGLAKLLTEDGIDCPMCHFRYALAKGGCMHFRCTQCQHDFCSGCSRPFKMGQKCGVSEFCAKLGLHAHHPRNCLFYLRDKEPEDLQKLLDLSGVKYDRDAPEGVDVKRTCQVMEQKETSEGMVDDNCGKEVEPGYAGLCRVHYVEYLGQLVNKHQVDPIQIFEIDDLELVLRRANIRLPPKRYRETDIQYREKLVKLIEEELPLDKMDGS